MDTVLRVATAGDEAAIRRLFVEMLRTIFHTQEVEGYPAGYVGRFFTGGEDEILVAEQAGAVVGQLIGGEDARLAAAQNGNVIDGIHGVSPLSLSSEIAAHGGPYHIRIHYTTLFAPGEEIFSCFPPSALCFCRQPPPPRRSAARPRLGERKEISPGRR